MIDNCMISMRVRTNVGAQSYSYIGLGDRVRVLKPPGVRHFVYDSQGRVVAEDGASSAEVRPSLSGRCRLRLPSQKPRREMPIVEKG